MCTTGVEGIPKRKNEEALLGIEGKGRVIEIMIHVDIVSHSLSVHIDWLSRNIFNCKLSRFVANEDGRLLR